MNQFSRLNELNIYKLKLICLELASFRKRLMSSLVHLPPNKNISKAPN